MDRDAFEIFSDSTEFLTITNGNGLWTFNKKTQKWSYQRNFADRIHIITDKPTIKTLDTIKVRLLEQAKGIQKNG